MTMRQPFSVPQSVADAVQERWPSAAAWTVEVPGELDQLCQRYKAEALRVLPARYSFVVEANGDGKRLIIRSTPDPQARFQTAVVRKLAKLEAGPRVHEVIETATSVWTVADRVVPGNSLFETDASTSVLARALAAMRGQSAPVPEMPSLTGWLRSRLKDDHLFDLPPGQHPASKQQRHRARSVLDGLTQDSVAELCHGDASPGNFLTSENFELLLIDPRGVCGEVAYDVAVAAMKTAPTGETGALASHLAHLVGVDPVRVTAWMKVAEAARV